jgi:ABC-type transport system involved in multi-copper enzyme maturation permease subunit
VGDRVMLWKELSYERHANYLNPGSLQKGDLGLLATALLFFFALCVFYLGTASAETLAEINQGFFRNLALPVGSLFFLAVALRAATTVSRERERQTLENLLTTPLDREEILFAKWLGGVLSVHLAWWAVLIALLFGLFTGSLHYLAVPLLALAFAVYASLAACVGLWYSTAYPTTFQATLWTTFAVLLIGAGPWMALYYGQNLYAPMSSALAHPWVERILTYGLCPLWTLQALAFHYGDFLQDQGASSRENVLTALAGMLFYALIALVLWRKTVDRLTKNHGLHG